MQKIFGGSPLDPSIVGAQAQRLKSRVATGAPTSALRGKKIGLLCPPGAPGAALLKLAAETLGARVAQVGAWEGATTPAEAEKIARTLGCLYDAIECEGMPEALQEILREHAGIPVFDGLASSQASAEWVGAILGPESLRDENRLYVVQALLMAALA